MRRTSRATAAGVKSSCMSSGTMRRPAIRFAMAKKGVCTMWRRIDAVSGATRYSSSKGAATASDVQPGALINVQFSPRADNRDVAQDVTVLAKPGDNYVFSGVVTNLDMRTSSFFVDNQADDQSYEVHFSPTAMADARSLKVGQEVTARAVFDGKQYKATNIRVENAKEQDQESKAQ